MSFSKKILKDNLDSSDRSLENEIFFLKSLEDNPKIKDIRCDIESVERTMDVEISKINIFTRDAQNNLNKVKEFDWSDELNEKLISLGIKSSRFEGEYLRFGLYLAFLFRVLSLRYGDGYANAVFKEYLQDTELYKTEQIKDIWDEIHGHLPSKGTPSYFDCRKMVNEIFVKISEKTLNRLHYSEGEADKILINSVSNFLTERFNITLRRKFFPRFR